MDDKPLVMNNPFIKTFHSLPTYFAQEDGRESDESGAQNHTGYYRPLINITYGIDYWLWGMRAPGFRLTNLILHAATCLLFFHFIMLLAGDQKVAFWTTLLFSLHPVNTEAVSWITSRNNILVTLFGLLTLILYLKGWMERRYGMILWSAVTFGGAIFSKEFGVMLLPVIFLFHRLVPVGKGRVGREVAGYLPFIFIVTGYLLLRNAVTGAVLSPSPSADLLQRLLFVPYLMGFNLRLLIAPINLHSFIVHYPSALFTRHVVIGFLVMGIILLFLIKNKKNGLKAFGVFAFMVALFPVLNVIDTSAITLISMRWLYFPMIFIMITISCFIRGLVKRGGVISMVLLGAVALYMGVYSHVLNRSLWHSEEKFFSQEVLNFHNPYYLGGLAECLFREKRFQEAEVFFQRAIREYPGEPKDNINYSALLLEIRRPESALQILSRVEHFPMTRQLRGEWFNNQGLAHFYLGNRKKALDALKRAVLFRPDEPQFWSNLGSVWGAGGDYKNSVDAFEKGLKIAKDSVLLKKNLAVTYLKMGETKKAVRILKGIQQKEMEKDSELTRLLEQVKE